jgi:midasin
MSRLAPFMPGYLCFLHGASLVFLDALGTGSTSIHNPSSLHEECFLHLTSLLDESLRVSALSVFSKVQHNFGFGSSGTTWGTDPFFIEIGKTPPRPSGFALSAKTTGENAYRVLRAMQVGKPILLEGSPGVGKTSLVVSMAAEAGHHVVRLNLSEQTDIMDLFGSDLPVEGSVGQFAWRDGPFLQALKNGDWVLLDELNLASQSVLEGLNACIDHRGEVFIPELNRTFQCNKQGFRLFACQNPLSQGGGRKGLPKSFLNRFTQVYVSSLDQEDMFMITSLCYSGLPQEMLAKMVAFNSRIQEMNAHHGIRSNAGDFNLRDVFRWCELLMANQSPPNFFPDEYLPTLYARRMRNESDIDFVNKTFTDVFGYAPVSLHKHVVRLTPQSLAVGHASALRQALPVHSSIAHLCQHLQLLPELMAPLETVVDAINMKWMVT